MSALDLESSVERRIRLQSVLLAWDTFMASLAYPFYVAAQEEEVELTKQAVVGMDPVDRVTEIESLKLRGDLRTEEQFVTYFEDVAARLKTEIEELLESEQPRGDKQKEK